MSDFSDRDVVVFAEAVQLPAEARMAYLERACAGDTLLHERVERLLRAHENAGEFLADLPAAVKVQSGRGITPGEKAGDRIGRYKLLEQIGEGGCGIVFMADQEEPVRRRVALKILKPGMDTKSVIVRFEAERQALALMEHPNIAKVLDAGATETGRPFFVMELVRGVKITEYCDENSLTTKERLALFIQICEAVQHAHQKGIIHRDIKPSNILVTTSLAGEPLPVVIDFGIAKATANQQLTDKTLFTAFAMLLGTPTYMSPEQALMTSVDVDTRSDIYSLGVLLYELLTGCTPFDARELLKAGFDEIRRVIREQEPLRPSTQLSKMAAADLTTAAQRRRSEVPTLIRAVRGDLDWIVIKAMAKDRTRRYETANGLALDIKRFLANEPISARPPGAFYTFQKTFSRNKLLFTSSALIAGLVIVSLIIISASLAREWQAHRETDVALQLAEADKIKAQLETAKAQVEAAKSQQVTSFLEDMLQGVGPSVALGRDTTMLREILDQTAGKIGREMTKQPAVEAELRGLIGEVYFEIGNYDQAEQMQRAALAIHRKLFDPESKEVAASLNDLGVTFWREWKQPEAEAALREALDIRRRLWGDENADVAASLNNLANVYRHALKPAVAEPLARESLVIRQKLFGNESLEAADSLRVLGILFGDENKWPECEATLQQVLAIRRKRLGPEHPLIASTLADVAWAAGHLGKWDEVESLQREAAQMQSKLLGDEHPATLDSLHNLSMTLEGEGKYTAAESFRYAALAAWRQKSGSESPRALEQLKSLVQDLTAEKKFGEMEYLLDETLTPAFISQSASADILSLRVDLLARQGRWAEAAADAALVVQYQPTDHYNYHKLAGLLVMVHNDAGYKQLCQKIIATFADTTDPYIAERMAQDCLLLPDAGVDLKVVDKMAEASVASSSAENDMPFSEACKALSDYRLGNYPSATKWAEKALQSSLSQAQAKAYAVLALTDYQLGKQDEAKVMLAKGNLLAPKISSNSSADEPGVYWLGWIFARVSLDEAAVLVQSTSATKK